jgi:hypothetical protein
VVLDAHYGPLMLELNARPGISIQIANRAGLRHRLETAERWLDSQPSFRRSRSASRSLGITSRLRERSRHRRNACIGAESPSAGLVAALSLAGVRAARGRARGEGGPRDRRGRRDVQEGVQDLTRKTGRSRRPARRVDEAVDDVKDAAEDAKD